MKFLFDVWYVDNRTIWIDFKIMWMTFKKVVSREGILDEKAVPKFKGEK
jgi:lipopolysaccharide/colanic/teichoic acid biosynthesis glycosyltransferase